MENILAQAAKAADEAEVFEITSEQSQVRFEANQLKHLETKQQSSAALRIIKNGRIGYATSTSTNNAKELVNNAVETAQFGSLAKFQFPGQIKYPEIEVFDNAVQAVTTEEMINRGQRMVEAITSHTPGILCEAGISSGTITLSIINSRGGQAEYRKTFFSMNIEGTLIEGTDMLFVGDGATSCHPILDATKITAQVIQQLDRAKRRASCPTKQMPVVFTPNGVSSALVYPLMAAFNGKTVLEGASPLSNKLGEKVFADQLTLRDDPTVSFRPESRPCDDEGTPSHRMPLIENGVVANFLYDLQTAGLAGKQSTGHGNRTRGSLPAPSPSAFIITPGSTTFNEMIADMKEGLVIEQLLGAEQGNILGGDFSGNILLGYKVKNGEIVGRVKDTMISGNVYQMLKDIAAIGSESRWVGSFLSTPPLYFPSIAVACKAE
jgi:PmbA protein